MTVYECYRAILAGKQFYQVEKRGEVRIVLGNSLKQTKNKFPTWNVTCILELKISHVQTLSTHRP